MNTIGYFDLISSKLLKMPNKNNTPGLSKALNMQRLKKEQAKVEVLVKAIEKHKDSTPDNDVRLCDQRLWSAGEMINYGK